MATNPPTAKALVRLTKLIKELDITPTQDSIDEIKAWNRLLIFHIREQRKQGGQWGSDRYEYDKRTKKSGE